MIRFRIFMEIKSTLKDLPALFWLPTALAIFSLLWNWWQSRQLVKLQTEAERKSLIHRHQFEKEFSIYTDLWAKLIELRNAAASLRPMLDQRDSTKSDDEIKHERLRRLSEKVDAVIDVFDKNKPFYSDKIYREISDLLRLSRFEAIEYQHGERSDLAYWEKAEKNISKIVDAMDQISNRIRERIQLVEVM